MKYNKTRLATTVVSALLVCSSAIGSEVSHKKAQPYTALKNAGLLGLAATFEKTQPYTALKDASSLSLAAAQPNITFQMASATDRGVGFDHLLLEQ